MTTSHNNLWFALVLAAVATTTTTVVEALANDVVYSSTLTASKGNATDRFGASVDISGKIAVVGAYLDDNLGTSSGSAYVYQRVNNNWQETAHLLAPDGAQDDEFGQKVVVSSSLGLIAVAARLHDDPADRSGAVYLYKQGATTTSWSFLQKLTSPNEQAGDQFGQSLALDGTTLLVGASGVAQSAGAVYVFDWDASVGQMKPTHTLRPAGVQAFDFFGWSVDLSGDTAVVGSYQDDHSKQQDAGSVYIFRRNRVVLDGKPLGQWNEQQQLLAPDPTSYDYFGWSVRIQGNTIVVGVFLKQVMTDQGAKFIGTAYTFSRQQESSTTWNYDMQLFFDDNNSVDNYFGRSCAITNDEVYIFCGASGHTAASRQVRSGVVMVFEREIIPPSSIASEEAVSGASYAWNRVDGATSAANSNLIMIPDGPRSFDLFGEALAINGNSLLVGAPGRNSYKGASYIYTLGGALEQDVDPDSAGPGYTGSSAQPVASPVASPVARTSMPTAPKTPTTPQPPTGGGTCLPLGSFCNVGDVCCGGSSNVCRGICSRVIDDSEEDKMSLKLSDNKARGQLGRRQLSSSTTFNQQQPESPPRPPRLLKGSSA